jgi:hypothetical protein
MASRCSTSAAATAAWKTRKEPLHIHTVTLAGGRTTQVTGGRVQDLMPAWQPLSPGRQSVSALGTTRVGTDAWRTRADDTVPSRTRRTGP